MNKGINILRVLLIMSVIFTTSCTSTRKTSKKCRECPKFSVIGINILKNRNVPEKDYILKTADYELI